MPKRFLRKRSTIIAGVIVVVLIVGFFILRGGKKPAEETMRVVRGNLRQEVAVTGATKPLTSVDLAFERSGTVRSVYADVGDAVTAGEVLVELDTAQLQSQRTEAQANAQAAQAKLDQLERGTRPEDIRIAQSALDKAEQDLAADYADVPNVLNDAYTKADDAVRKQTADIFTNGEDANPQLVFTVFDSQTKVDTELLRFKASQQLTLWSGELKDLNAASTTAQEAALRAAADHLTVIQTFLNRTMDAVNGLFGASATAAANYKSELTTARTNVTTALTNVTTQAQAITTQKVVIQQAQDQLALQQAGPTQDEIVAQAALVKQAEAQVQTLDVQIAKSLLRSPIAGVVTKQDAKRGELAVQNQPLVSVISAGDLQIEANVPEADIAKIAIGDPTTLTLDAYGDQTVFDATVVKIDPAETLVEGVATYKTTFNFTKADPRVRPGMTANLTILTDKRENVLVVPQRWLVAKDDHTVALVYRNGQPPEERTVLTGLRGSDGNVEVLSELSEGETIVRPTQ
jgi:HlyD family secretion protein